MKRLPLFLSSFSLIFGFISCKNNTTGKFPDNEMMDFGTLPRSLKDVEEFRFINDKAVQELNNVISSNHINTEEGIMREYAPEDTEAEGDYIYIIKRINTSDSNAVVISLLEDGINDDSVKARKVIMTLAKIDGQFVIKQIKESYKCWQGRGHEDWSSAYCM